MGFPVLPAGFYIPMRARRFFVSKGDPKKCAALQCGVQTRRATFLPVASSSSLHKGVLEWGSRGFLHVDSMYIAPFHHRSEDHILSVRKSEVHSPNMSQWLILGMQNILIQQTTFSFSSCE